MKTLAVVISTLIIFAGLCNLVSADCPDYPDTILCDDFEYVVGREDPLAYSIFQSEGGWTWAKTQQSYGSGNGYLYTVDSIPGYSGSFPGLDSNYVLAIEALPETYGYQTDFYLQYGDTENPANENLIPGDVWFQFWLYINYYGYQLSQINARDKFIYPCDGPYPCNSGKWLFMIGSGTYNPLNQAPFGVPSNGEAFLVERDNQVGDIAYELAEPWDQSKLGQNDISEHLAANRWTLVKLHFDTSTTSGSWEAWLKPVDGDWIKVVEWIDGITPNFHWILNSGDVGGHRGFKMPTTFPANNVDCTDPLQCSDAWIYMDDFAMAASESTLPTYDSLTTGCPQGEITSSCICGNEEKDSGFCCQDVWFDPYYQEISGGCPSGSFYYVDQDHPQASDSNPGTEDLPWDTLGRAVWGSSDRGNQNPSLAAQAGDIVIVKNGTYSTTQGVGERYDPIYNSVNSGSPGNYIIFKAENKNGVTLESYTSGEGEPIIGSYQRDYIVWDGFYLDEERIHDKSDTGPVVGWGASFLVFKDLEINGFDKSWSDNHNGIRLEWADNVVIRNNVIYGIAGNWGDNEVAVMTYDSHDLLIEHNEFFDCGSGIFIKGMYDEGKDSQYNVTIRYNLLHGLQKGLFVYGVHRDYDAYQNIVWDCGSAVHMTGCSDPCPVNPEFVNNVFDGSTGAGITPILCNIPGAFNGARLWNNIVSNGNYALDSWTGCSVSDFSDESLLDFEHNCYYGNSRFSEFSGCSTLAGWQSVTGQDSSAPASISSDPMFVDRGGHDYHLSASSPARNAGIDILDLDGDGSTTNAVNLGAYITGDEVIGPTDSYQASPTQDPDCSDGQDNDGDGQVDLSDPGCDSATDNSEYGSAECDDGQDNDGDGDVDYRASGGDGGCSSLSDNDETNCGDGVCEGGEDSSSCSLDCGGTNNCVADLGGACCSAGQSCSEGTFQASDDCGSLCCVLGTCQDQVGVTITVDSTYPGYSMDVVDDEVIDPYGGTSTTWASGESFTEPHWVAIGFSEPRSINNVTIYWAYNFVMEAFMSSQEVWIQHWNGIDYENVSTITNTGYVEASSTSFDPVTTAGLRLFQPPDSGPVGYSNILWLTEIDYSSSTHPADTNGDGCIFLQELLAFVKRWKVSSRDVPMPELMEAIGLWNQGTGCQQ